MDWKSNEEKKQKEKISKRKRHNKLESNSRANIELQGTTWPVAYDGFLISLLFLDVFLELV